MSSMATGIIARRIGAVNNRNDSMLAGQGADLGCRHDQSGRGIHMAEKQQSRLRRDSFSDRIDNFGRVMLASAAI